MNPTTAQEINMGVAVRSVRATFTDRQILDAIEIIERGWIKPGPDPVNSPDVYLVLSSDGETWYRTHPQLCTCPRNKHAGQPCKHRAAAIIARMAANVWLGPLGYGLSA